jgi:hypothetical protein
LTGLAPAALAPLLPATAGAPLEDTLPPAFTEPPSSPLSLAAQPLMQSPAISIRGSSLTFPKATLARVENFVFAIRFPAGLADLSGIIVWAIAPEGYFRRAKCGVLAARRDV